ncbi:unnamed protein product [Periconia digitata]|uniref:AB hydrolase-1 domain-containing protein n=1 Tax=Periconia digitata TaxID=1303443 RepID=A0A9W4XVN2_9PLEO|nr:unnamed protein product [Periconia digitata]
MAAHRPFFVIVPGAAQNPAHHGYLSHLLLLKGYPVLMAWLPSVASAEKVTAADDAAYIRNKMILPVLDYEGHDVILIMHSYSGIPGSAAAAGLGQERIAQGKKTSVIGQIFVTSLLATGGEGKSTTETYGGELPPHISADPVLDLLRGNDRRVEALYNDVPQNLIDAVAVSGLPQGKTSLDSPLPRASWDTEEYKGRVAYIRALKDVAHPVSLQQTMLDLVKGVDWIIKDIDSGHCPQLSRPEEYAEILVELATTFMAL